MKMLWKSALPIVLEVLLPSRCALCGDAVEPTRSLSLCHACRRDLRPIEPPRCPTCGRPLAVPDLTETDAGLPCGPCRLAPPHLDHTLGLLYFEGAARETIHRLKYQGHWQLGRALVQWCHSRLVCLQGAYDLVAPVPLDRRRLRQRGFNQSAVIGREVASILGLPLVLNGLIRIRGGQPQVGLKGTARQRNVRGCFAVQHHERLVSSRVLLVDDVLTTGATANECARILKAAGAEEVGLVTVAAAYASL